MSTLDTKTPDPFAALEKISSWKERFSKEDALLKSLMEVSNSLPTPLSKCGKYLVSAAELPKTVVGRILRWQIADGYAFYRVTSAKPLKLQRLAFGDRWQVPYETIRGLRLVDAANMVIRELAFRKLFS